MSINLIKLTRSSTFFFLVSFSALILQGQGQPPALTGNSSIHKDTLAARGLIEKEVAFIAAGNYQAAINTALACRDLYIKHEQWEDAIRRLISLAELSDYIASADLKVEYANQALQSAQKHLPNNHLVLGLSFRQKAESLMMFGLLDSANYFLNLAIPIFEKRKDWTNFGWSEIILGVSFLNQYQLDSCQHHFQKVALLLQEKELPEQDEAEIHADLLSLFGVLYEIQGDYDKSIENTKKALSLDLNKEQLTALDSFTVSNHYKNLGAYYLNKGDYQRALDNNMSAISADKNASTDPKLLNNIGELMLRQRKYREASNYFQQSLLFTSKQKNQLNVRMNALNGLGVAFREIGLLDSALYYCQKAIDLPSNYRKPLAWSGMGNTLTSQKKASKALEYLSIAERIYLKDSTAYVHSPFLLSKIYELTANAHLLNQDPQTALNYYQKGLIANHADFRDSILLENNPSLIGIYDPTYFLGNIRGKGKAFTLFSNEQNHLEKALSCYQLTIQWIDTLQTSYATETSQLDWSSEFKPIYEEAIQVAFRLYQNTKDSKYLDLAFAFSEKSKNAILLETLKSNEGKSLADVPDSLLQKEKDLNLDIAFYEKSLQKAKESDEAAKEKLYQQYLSKTRLELVALKEQLEKDYPKFHAWKYGGKTTTIADIQAKLVNKQSAFLEYFIGDSTAYVFVISKNSADLLSLSSPAQIKNAVADFRQVLLNPASFERNAKAAFSDYYQKALTVYQHILLTPIAALPAGIRQLVIVPDGVLNAVPFEALCKETEVKADFDFALLPYVLYDYQLYYAYSADLLLKNQTQRERLPANTACLAFAPPYQGALQIAQRGSLDQLRGSAGQLEGTAREIQQISQFITGEFDFGATATERQFKAKANQFGILHLAMHGVVDLENANFNHLKFSDLSQDSTEDNLLHHYEIANMDLQAQLVVLSACETGVGKYEKGEGVFSLARSFMYAGVPSVVMSLWKVSDASTSQLMPFFYENLADGQSKDGALHQAKLRFLQEANMEYRHPFFWSAFVVMGDAEALKTSGSNLLWWGLGVLLLVGLGGWFWRKRYF